MAKDSWGTVKLPNGQRKEVRRAGEKIHVRDPGAETHTTVALKDFLSALVIEMDRKTQRPIEGTNLVEAMKMADNPLPWKITTFILLSFFIGYMLISITS